MSIQGANQSVPDPGCANAAGDIEGARREGVFSRICLNKGQPLTALKLKSTLPGSFQEHGTDINTQPSNTELR